MTIRSATVGDGFTLTVNGRRMDSGASPPTRTLLQFVRDQGLVGTKEGCGEGDCGACTVAIAGRATDGSPAFVAVNSCLVPIGVLADAEVITVEGVTRRGSDLHPVQQALVESAGSQCGYCTPGFVMSMFAAFHDPIRDTDCGLGDDAVEGNLCRCTGYVPIRRACQSLAGVTPAGLPVSVATVGDTGTASRAVTAVAARGRHLLRPTTIVETLDLLAEHPEAVLLAGGTDLGIELSHHRIDPTVTVAIDHVAELSTLDITDSRVRIGAALPLSHLEHRARGVLPALDEMIHWFAARQIRNRATIGGNLGTGSPIGDLPPVLLALDAVVTVAGPGQSEPVLREVPIDDFFTGYRTTVLAPGEIITAVTIARPDRSARDEHVVSWSYKVGKRGTDDISIVAAAFCLTMDAPMGPTARVTSARLAYGGVAATPVRAHAVESSLVGRILDADTVTQTAAALGEAFTPLDDLRASARYRRRITGSLFEKFVHQFSAVAR